MKRWQDFLDSLSTVGGGIALLSVATTVLLGVLVHLLHHGDTGEIVTILTGAFSGAFSALLLALKGNSSKQQMSDRANPGALADPQKTEGVKA